MTSESTMKPTLGLTGPRHDFLKQLNEIHTRVQHHIELNGEQIIDRQDVSVHDIYSEKGSMDFRPIPSKKSMTKFNRVDQMR